MLTSCGLFGAMFVDNSNQPEEGCCFGRLLTCVWRIIPMHREAILPLALQHHWHTDLETLLPYLNRTAHWQKSEIQRTGRGKPPQSESIRQSTENLVLRAESPAVTLSHWNLTVKNCLVRQLWVWQGRAGGLQRHSGPPAHIPSSSAAFPLITFSCHLSLSKLKSAASL